RRAALRQRLEDQRGVEARQRGAANVVANIDPADPQLGCLAHHVDGEMLLLVPAHRMRRDPFRGEIPRHLANRNLVLVERELHAAYYPRRLLHRHCEPTGRAHARPMTGSAKQSIPPRGKRMDCFVATLLAMTAPGTLVTSSSGSRTPRPP